MVHGILLCISCSLFLWEHPYIFFAVPYLHPSTRGRGEGVYWPNIPLRNLYFPLSHSTPPFFVLPSVSDVCIIITLKTTQNVVFRCTLILSKSYYCPFLEISSVRLFFIQIHFKYLPTNYFFI